MDSGRFRKIMSVLQFVRLFVRMEQLGSQWTDFHEIWIWSIFQKSVEKIQVLLKSDEQRALHIQINTHFSWFLAPFYFDRNICKKTFVEKIKTYISCSIGFSPDNRAILWHNVEKYCTDGQATEDNTAHAHFMLDT